MESGDLALTLAPPLLLGDQRVTKPPRAYFLTHTKEMTLPYLVAWWDHSFFLFFCDKLVIEMAPDTIPCSNPSVGSQRRPERVYFCLGWSGEGLQREQCLKCPFGGGSPPGKEWVSGQGTLQAKAQGTVRSREQGELGRRT